MKDTIELAKLITKIDTAIPLARKPRFNEPLWFLDQKEEETYLSEQLYVWAIRYPCRLDGLQSLTETIVAELDPELVSLWDFEEGEGTTAYDRVVRNRNNLSLVQFVSWIGGRVGSGLRIENSQGYAEAPHSASINLGIYTYEFWIRPRTPASGDWSQILRKGLTNLGERQPGLWFHPGSLHLHFASSIGATNQVWLNTQTALPVNEWSHVAIVQGQNLRRIYINGKLDAESTIAFTPYLNDKPLRVGRSGDYTSTVLFDIDELRIYKTVLPAEAIARHAQLKYWKTVGVWQ